MSSEYLPGTPVIGFHGLFEEDYGDPQTPKPYCRVTPSRSGSTLLPFSCPRCHSSIDFSDSKNREAHHDTRSLNGKRQNNHFCPHCGLRFYLNEKGKEYNGALSSGVAPSTADCVVLGEDGNVEVERRHWKNTILGSFRDYVVGCDILGCC